MDHKTVYQKVVCNMDQMGGRMVMRRWKLFILIVIGMIIIGGAVLAIRSGKLILPVEKKESFVAESYENYPTRLCVSGNKIIDENKNEIVLKGLMAPDPQKILREGNFSKAYYDGIFSFGGNAIRVPVHPDMYVTDEYYMWRFLDQIVGWAGECGQYVIIDWHYIGNPVTGDGKEMPDMQKNHMELTKQFWEQTASYFKDATNVIFEIYNEPACIGSASWEGAAKEITNVIRESGANQLIIIGSPDYSYNLRWIKESSISDPNVAYSVHVFPNKTLWKKKLSEIQDEVPLIVTEWGYIDSDISARQSYLKGSRKSFGEPFVDYLADNNIGWVACWYDDGWEPPIFSDENNSLTEWGKFLKEYAFTR